MATRADMMLVDAMTQFGQGLGSMLGRRRMGREAEEEAERLFPNIPMMPDQVTPEGNALVSAMTGGMPGGGMAADAMGMAYQATAQAGNQQIGLMNDENALVRALIGKDPRMLAQVKEQMLAARMPKEQELIQTNWGVFQQQPDGSLKTLTEPPKDKKRRVLKPGDVLYDEETGEVLTRIPEDVKQKTWLSEESRMGDNGVPEVRPTIIREDGTSIPAGPWGPSSRAFGITTPVMGTGERAKWRDRIEETRRSLREFGEIKRMFDPEFLTTVGRARSGVGEIMSRFNVIDLFPGEKERYSDRNEFFTAVSDRANRYIKEITGAQMSEAEASRLLTAIPNVKDDPVAFSDKLNRVISVSESALDQYEKVLWSTRNEDAARAAADRVVRAMMGEPELESEPSFIGD